LSHPIILETRSIRWADEAACRQCAAELATRPALRDAYVALQGPLGAGKTTFARHLLHALGVAGRIKSPTYAVVEPYEVQRADGPLAIAHFDFYRFARSEELDDAGLREMFAAKGLKLAEWPEKAADRLPPPDLRLTIEPDGEQLRLVTLQAHSERGRELLG
jgi:tRNA threonylcarbamoyladenosine biosynthesis protein TsaE